MHATVVDVAARTGGRPRHQSTIPRAIRILLTLAAFTVVGTSAWAYWTTSGNGVGQAATDTLSAPTGPTAINTLGSGSVNLTWVESTGTPPQGYYVTRVQNSDGSMAAGGASSPTTLLTGSSCTDQAVPDGLFHYVVTAALQTWTAPSDPSSDVTIRTASKLAFTTAPSASATSGTALAAQPAVAVQDASGVTVTSNTSLVTLTLTTPAGGTLSCAANTTGAMSGVASFTGCKIDKAATYTLTATDGSLTAATSTSVTVTAGAAARFAITSAPVAGAASATANLGPMTVQEQDTFGNPVNAPTGGTTVALASSSAGIRFFSTTANGASATSVTSVTIASGAASSASFYYADTRAGSPVITASGALTSGTQTETVTAAGASKLVITSPALSGIRSNTSANLGPVTVQQQDTFGNPVTASGAGTTVNLSSTAPPLTAVFATTRNGPTSGVTSVTIPSGASSADFYYGCSTAGSPVITAASGSLTSATQTETITNTTLVITSTAVSGQASTTANLGAITVQEQDSLGAAVVSPVGGTVVNLSSSSTGTKLFSTTANGGPGTSVSSVTITVGNSSVAFYYGDTKAGSPLITASSSTTSATQTETITALTANKFAITSAPVSGTACATASVGPITVQEQDVFGNPVSAPSGGTSVTLASSSPGTKVFAGTVNGTPATTVTIAQGTSSAPIYYGDTKAGSPVITASGSLTSATQTETIVAGAASKFAITTTAVSGPASAGASLGPITVQLQGGFGNPVNAPTGGTTVSLSSSSVGPKVFAITQNGASVTSVTVPAGQSSVNFYYGDSRAGSPMITVSGSLTSATQNQTITALAATKFAFTTTAVSGPASILANLGPITVQAQDSFGNPVNVGSITTVNLASGSAGTKFFSLTPSGGSGTAVTSVTIASGAASSASFYYGDNKAGSPVITASGPLTSATQTETITAAAASKLVITSTAWTATTSSTANLGPITVQRQDIFGNLVTASATTVTLSSSSNGTKRFATSLNGPSVTSVTITTGTSSASFFYGDTKKGSPVITASSTSLTSATQSETITAGAATKFVITSVAVSGAASATASRGPITVEQQDSFGTPVTSGSFRAIRILIG